MICLKTSKPGKIYFNTDLFQCTFVFLLLPGTKTVFYCGPVVFEKIQGNRFEELFSSLPLKDTYHDSIQAYYQKLPFLGSYAMFESLFLEFGKKLYGDSCEVSIPILIFLIIGITPIRIVCGMKNIRFQILM